MVKAEWGTKRACPKCNTRFYDLTKDEPVTCINCGYAWMPEPVLKSKQTMPFEQAKPAIEKADGDDDLATVEADDIDLEVAEAEATEAPDVDLGDDDDLGAVVTGGDEDEH